MSSQIEHHNSLFLFAVSSSRTGEKRKLPEALTLEDAKRIRVMGDIPMELVNEVMMTITDPAAMLGPEVSSSVRLLHIVSRSARYYPDPFHRSSLNFKLSPVDCNRSGVSENRPNAIASRCHRYHFK